MEGSWGPPSVVMCVPKAQCLLLLQQYWSSGALGKVSFNGAQGLSFFDNIFRIPHHQALNCDQQNPLNWETSEPSLTCG